ncbi:MULTISPECIES: hypothetical protein [Agrobacterium tumefaciens complex]|nr:MULTISPECIES: hypothetical protein [Agrobacterium tumefaciens complex]MBB4405396.1 hypothetical protein [Agrobacterium radiobacter]MBB4451196.1 hypothetical protein [Agrobacterium radiobacter]MDR6587817.1 hypothetical protein [Agrobacterium tumefaciens]
MEEAACGRKSSRTGKRFINDYNIGAKTGMTFASRNAFFKGKNGLCQHPVGGRQHGGRAAAGDYAS